jgi:glyoxylase-like metal-dependent hydrolase (beta-lactamase superfamily II)
MQRRHFLRNAGLSASLLALAPKDLLAAFLQQPAYKLTMLRNNVGIFNEKGGTIAFYLSDEGIVVVDSQYPATIQHAIDELKKINQNPFKLLINTHHHGDHTGGNIAFKGLVEHVVGHENCLSNYKRVAAEQKSEDKQLFQDITFKDTWKYKIGKEKIKAHYFGAAHTSGDAMIHFQNANIVHMGDLMFNRIYPVIDRKAGASFKHWTIVLDKALDTFDDDTIFVFGHGSNNAVVGSKDDLRGMQQYINQLFKLVDENIKAGKSKEDILQITSIPNVAEWKDEFKLIKINLETAYLELTT